VRWGIVDRNARKGKLPSDHAPVVIDIDDDRAGLKAAAGPPA